jgi:hypothetical protein
VPAASSSTSPVSITNSGGDRPISRSRGGQLYLNTGSNVIENAGLLEASAGGRLLIQSGVSNRGRIDAIDGSTVVVNGAIIDSGLFETAGTDSRIELQGAAVTGTLATNAGAVIDVVPGRTSVFDGSAALFNNS